MEDNLYKILGVSDTVSAEEIKKVYRKKAKEMHPDKGGDEEEFKKISNAYNILSDPSKRSDYDNQLKYGNQQFRSHGFNGNMGQDIFDQFFNRNNRAYNIPKKGEDLVVSVSLTLEEIYSGTSKNIKYNKMIMCSNCNGSGAHDDKSHVICSGCNGSGQKIRQSQTFFGGMTQMITTCNECGGEGKTITVPCNNCNGKGCISSAEDFMLNVPHGVQNGMAFTVESKGNYSKGAQLPGNLIIQITEIEHPNYIRVNNDLHFDFFITIPQSILGVKDIIVPTISGNVKIHIEPGVESGRTLRLQGKGMSIFNHHEFGNFYIHINVYIPKEMSDEDKKSIESLLKNPTFDIPKDINQKGVFKRFMELSS